MKFGEEIKTFQSANKFKLVPENARFHIYQWQIRVKILY